MAATENQSNLPDKKKTFWEWIWKSEHNEDGDNITIDKRIPQYSSIAAVILFLFREYIIHEGDEGVLFTGFNFTVSLQLLNIVVLFFILARGLKISKINKEKLTAGKVTADQVGYYVNLEIQFVRFIKYFFAMTICLYFFLLLHSFVDSDRKSKYNPVAKNEILREIRNSVREIKQDKDTLGKSLFYGCSCPLNFTPTGSRIKENFCVIDRSLNTITGCLAQTISQDTIPFYPTFTSQACELTNAFQKIDSVNDSISNAIVNIDSYVKLVDSDKYSSLIKSMYHARNKIAEQTEGDGNDIYWSIAIDILVLVFSNMGALYLVYCFLVLFIKTLDSTDIDVEDSLLAFKNVFPPWGRFTDKNGNRKKRSRQGKTACVILFFLYVLFLLLTGLQATLELLSPNISDKIYTVFMMLGGLSTALTLSVLVARFESTSFNSSFSILLILYLYANIQILFGFFKIPLLNPHLIEDFTMIIALVGKCFLYLYILWIIRTDRLKFYFYRRKRWEKDSTPLSDKLNWDDFIKEISPATTDMPKGTYLREY